MFTGLVREVGKVASFRKGRLVVETVAQAAPGDSVALDGVCLTVVDVGAGRLAFDVVPETLDRTKPFRDRVNVEPALRAGEPLGGHYVQGHVDGVGRVVSAIGEGPSVVIRLAIPPELRRYLVERGFVAVDGASLTVMRLRPDGCDVSLVHHTQQAITLPRKRPGAPVNIEVDVVGKYVERLVASKTDRGVTLDLLRRSGFA